MSQARGTEEGTKRFWASWIVSDDDYRPLTYPPNPAILGWWCSGYDAADNAILCGLVEAHSIASAKGAILRDWPGVTWRFFEPKPPDFTVASDRFQLSDWMKTRMGQPQPTYQSRREGEIEE